jgi:hypothetical protein
MVRAGAHQRQTATICQIHPKGTRFGTKVTLWKPTILTMFELVEKFFKPAIKLDL